MAFRRCAKMVRTWHRNRPAFPLPAARHASARMPSRMARPSLRRAADQSSKGRLRAALLFWAGLRAPFRAVRFQTSVPLGRIGSTAAAVGQGDGPGAEPEAGSASAAAEIEIVEMEAEARI